MVRYTAVHTICDSLDVHGRYIAILEKLFLPTTLINLEVRMERADS